MNILRPYHLLGLAGTILLSLSFLVTGQTVDIHLHDTYFVIDGVWFVRIAAIFLLICWVIIHIKKGAKGA